MGCFTVYMVYLWTEFVLFMFYKSEYKSKQANMNMVNCLLYAHTPRGSFASASQEREIFYFYRALL